MFSSPACCYLRLLVVSVLVLLAGCTTEKKEKLFRDNVNSDVVAKIRLEIMMLPFNQDLFPKSRFNLVDLHTQLCEYYLFGIASLKGFKVINKYQYERSKKMKQNEKKQAS